MEDPVRAGGCEPTYRPRRGGLDFPGGPTDKKEPPGSGERETGRETGGKSFICGPTWSQVLSIPMHEPGSAVRTGIPEFVRV